MPNLTNPIVSWAGRADITHNYHTNTIDATSRANPEQELTSFLPSEQLSKGLGERRTGA